MWWSERRATAAFGAIVRPDGYGEWVQHGRRVGFFLELDRGTEPLPRLVDKLTGYAHLTELGTGHPVLILLPTTTRETHLHEYLRAHPRTGAPAAAGSTVRPPRHRWWSPPPPPISSRRPARALPTRCGCNPTTATAHD